MLNLLITNHYSPNKGDCAILTAMIENIRRLDPDCTITVSSSHPNLTKKLNLEINNIIPWPIDYASGIRGYLRSSLYLVRTIAIGLLTKLRLTNLNALNYRAEDAFLKADIIISAGGHHFTNNNGNISLAFCVLPIVLARVLSKPYVLMSQSIGPICGNALARVFLKKLFDDADFISVRDEFSMKCLRNDFFINNALKSSDLVFLLDTPKKRVSLQGIKHKPSVGISLYELKQPWLDKIARFEIQQKYEQGIANLINHLIQKYDAEITILSMERLAGDAPVINRVMRLVRNKENVTIKSDVFRTQDILNLLSELDIVVTSKTHTLYLSLACGIPCIAIYYHKKSEDIMKEVGLSSFCIDFTKVKYDALIQMTEKLLSDHGYKEFVNRANIGLRDAALLSLNLLSDEIKKIKS